MMRNLSLRRALRSEDGAVTAAYVIGFPVVFIFFMIILELCFLMMRSTMLQHALDVTLRDVRLGTMVNPTTATLEQAICDGMGAFSGCTSSLTLEFTRIDTATFLLPAPMDPCVARSAVINAARANEVYVTGAPNELMAVRACVLVDTITPYLSDVFEVTARAAFVNEPG